ncbi:SRPBCC family protein [Pelagibacterium xiamenense]|uniref:SRPBCC family protein n=1 Tax=Pelagibacterium xiamenense TaxID=2901140 RepID=UPI001E4EDFA1|nr:SRPBCC family protein [Pelagibacterium xiamenense]MCD7059690.1 SRPBCC family protein [Pelagibacterium xiamenense]
MDIDVEKHLGAVSRSVSEVEVEGKPARAVTLTRAYETNANDLWDALTNQERLPRWFAPVDGNLEKGGQFQVQGNASGTITACAPPRSFAATWEFGGEVSWIEVTLSPDGPDRTQLVLVHTAPVTPHWAEYGPGAVGVGWELGLMGLALHLSAPDAKFNEDEFNTSPEAKAFMTGSGDAWAEADIASGEDPAQARGAADRAIAFYTGATPPGA